MGGVGGNSDPLPLPSNTPRIVLMIYAIYTYIFINIIIRALTSQSASERDLLHRLALSRL